MRAWREENPERARDYSRRFNQKYSRGPGWKKHLITDARRRAREKGIPFELTADDFEIPEFCPILGVRLIHGDGKTNPASATLDRVIPDRGYTPGNIQVISHRANRMKSDASPEMLRMFADWINKTYEVTIYGSVALLSPGLSGEINDACEVPRR